MKLDILKAYQPALFVALQDYNREKFTADLLAGVIVGIVALPLAIAFGIAVGGFSRRKEFNTAVIAGFIVSLPLVEAMFRLVGLQVLSLS